MQLLKNPRPLLHCERVHSLLLNVGVEGHAYIGSTHPLIFGLLPDLLRGHLLHGALIVGLLLIKLPKYVSLAYLILLLEIFV